MERTLNQEQLRGLLAVANMTHTGTLSDHDGNIAGFQLTLSADFSQVITFLLAQHVMAIGESPTVITVTAAELDQIIQIFREG